MRFSRKPDVVIGGANKPYLLRWWIIPRNRFFNIYLHKFLRDDDDRALHDHPWASCSIILRSGYIEHLPGGVQKVRKPGHIVFRRATQAHRVELNLKLKFVDFMENGWLRTSIVSQKIPAWTIFITGPKVRDWGFLCPQGWQHWTIFSDPEDTTEPSDIPLQGKGCGE